MTAPPTAPSLASIEARIAPLRDRLAAHPLYRRIQTRDQLRSFMESHVYAVWDFMSLLKSLQQQLTCVSAPWLPTRWPESRRFVNEIVLGEESDNFEGRSTSHFELYLDAMEECGADTRPVRNLLRLLQEALPGTPISEILGSIPQPARSFVQSTFAVIQSGQLASIAAAFTFGREDVIPDMFRELVRDLDRSGIANLRKLVWYLERHIELDGDDHGPLSLRMVRDLCGHDERLWEDAAIAAEFAITARLAFWDAILAILPDGR